MTSTLVINDLTVRFRTGGREFVALCGLDLAIAQGEVMALVGESGSGKSLTALSVMGLLPEVAEIVSGSIKLEGRELVGLPEHAMAKLRGARVGLIFQEPMTSLNPTMRVGPQVAEVLRLHRGLSLAEARLGVERLFEMVRISDPVRRYNDYPHQMSGGMRQRVVIALAIACSPALVIADEPTTALDVTTQAQILDLFLDLRQELGMATLLITHDLAVVAETAERVAVMYAGRIVEEATVEQLFGSARHPYTHGLLGSLPAIHDPAVATEQDELVEIPGAVPALWDLPAGCSFSPRCPRATDRCRREVPALFNELGGRRHACFHPYGVERS